MKIIETKGASLGAVEFQEGKFVEITIDHGKKTLEIVKDIDSIIDDVQHFIPPIKALGIKIMGLFNSLFFRLPCSIIIKDDEGNRAEYFKTEQPVWGRANDKIWYQSEEKGFNGKQQPWVKTYRVYYFEATTLVEVRQMARKALKEDGYLKEK